MALVIREDLQCGITCRVSWSILDGVLDGPIENGCNISFSEQKAIELVRKMIILVA